MYLKSLNIVGFKTFADETELIFDPGFTAVVGPNGSGKSNIVDAIKWVLGEKSAKGLRGEKMDDVIFHGSESREPGGFAEVSVNLDNSGRIFNIDFPTVKITRRLYPDHTNEYFINNSRALRKDVEKMLLDTGVGKASYSIMEQGKVEAILNSKPEERRAIFDEAAGISRFKMDRLETEKKLEYTAQNLLRINDIMVGMEKELELKERQAEKAKKYFQLKNDLSEVDKNLRYLKWRSLQNRTKKVENELEEVQKRYESIMTRMNEDAKLIEEYETKKFENEQKITDIDKQLMDFLSQKEILKEKVEKNKSIISEFDVRIQEQLDALNQDLSRKERYESEVNSINDTIEGIRENLTGTISSIQKFEEKHKGLEEELETLQKEIVECETKITANDREHNSLRETVKEIVVSLINQIENKKRESEATENERKEIKEYLISSLDDYIQITEKILSGGEIGEIRQGISQLQFREYKENLKRFLEMEDVFRDILFDKDGMLVRKESMDQKIEDLILENDNLTSRIRENNGKIEDLREQLSTNKDEIYNLEKQATELKSKHEGLVSNRDKVLQMIEEVGHRISGFESSMNSINERKRTFEDEVRVLEEQIEKSYLEFLNISKTLESEKTELRELMKKIQDLKSATVKDKEDFQNLLPIRTELERKSSGLKVQMDTFNEELYNDYSMTDSELEAERSEKGLKQDAEETKSREIKSDIQLLGSINPLAIEEYQNIREIYEHHKSQREDIEKSKKDIEDVLKNINSESEKLFIETFNVIRDNFQETFVTLFNGGRANIELTDKSDVLNCGIEITAEPPGKHVQNLKLLSGGEKSLTVIALLFAIYMVRPSPFCFLDEIDAALDEVNKLRFCQILDRFKDTSQFIVITHAPPTISRANTIFGVTSEEPGVSKVVSLKMEEAKNFSKRIQEAV
ncbi:MAG: AAA family ATPase [Leptospiraceae bacterium]|nr:AAA family ATPase [Leptospiraceae bacterium]MCP5511435.1 AAA family ATPase [Leptospiraceae bacterium]